ncbi:MAG: hypothetical protein R3223_02485 [Longimicrobiales bacterium]|nr:hypothetical protein [Longimicrobiales bacterium]
MIQRIVPGAFLVLAAASAAVPAAGFGTLLHAQTATVSTEENFRAEPNGTLLGRIRPGTVLGVASTEGEWVRATLSGWVWNPSLEATDREGFDLLVSVDGGENLRVEPQGTILARLEEGTLLEVVERGDSWTRVRRTAWIWRPSVEMDEEAADSGVEAAPEEEGAPGGWSTVGPDGLAILSAPDGDTLARGAPGSQVRVLGRQGSWARVQVEGWAWMPDAEAGDAPADTAVLTEVGPDDVAANPDRYRGRVVSWPLQFISREEAESVRTDFYEGEPYLLTRSTGASAGFVYVAVPPERLSEVQALMPLERIHVVGRIRTGSAALTGGPILDLLDLSRGAPSGGDGR